MIDTFILAMMNAVPFAIAMFVIGLVVLGAFALLSVIYDECFDDDEDDE